jgi:small subunit ribosomal protein S6
MFVLKPTLTPEETQAKIQMFKDLLVAQGGEIAGVEDWGTKKLAYKVEKFDRGYYFVCYFKAPGKAVQELERVYKVTEDIIKFMTLKYTKKVETKAWQAMVDKSNGKKPSAEAPKAPVAVAEAPKADAEKTEAPKAEAPKE